MNKKILSSRVKLRFKVKRKLIIKCTVAEIGGQVAIDYKTIILVTRK